MKRTNILTLSLLGIALAACAPSTETPEAPKAYDSVAACVADGKTDAECKKANDEARRLTEEQAPRFASAQACEQQFGAGGCQQSESGGWFLPAAMGFMLGNMMANNSSSGSYEQGREDERRRRGGSTYIPPRPVYRTPSGGTSVANFSGGKYSGLTPAPTVSTYSSISSARAASTSSRGGFGGRASASVSS